MKIIVGICIIICIISLIVIKIISIKKEQKKIALALIQYINNFNNLMDVIEKEHIDLSLYEDFESLNNFYDLIINNECCKIIKLNNDENKNEFEKYDYTFNFNLMKNANIDLDFIELSNVLLIEFICKLLKLKVMKNENLENALKELNYM